MEPAAATALGFITKPLNQSILQQERVEMECFVHTSLTPSFMWIFVRKGQSQPIVDGHNVLTPDYFVKLGERSQVLIIKKLNGSMKESTSVLHLPRTILVKLKLN